MIHKSVLLSELIQYLDPQPNQNFIDATVGLAGHARAILLKTKPSGKVLGIDQDKRAILALSKTKIDQLILYFGNFKNIDEIAKECRFSNIFGIYFDLGLGSWQITDSQYGLSFQKDMPLSMLISPFSDKPSAQVIVNKWSKPDLVRIFREYGELKRPHQVAEKIIQYRSKKSIVSTLELVEVIGIKNPSVLAKIFQSLRIFVNDELPNLKETLPKAVDLLVKGGRIAVISYHSGEDRIVKNFFKEKKESVLKILTKKPVIPSRRETERNPKARSAKLRVAEKI